MSDPFGRRLRRARTLSARFPESRPLLRLYEPVLELQAEIFESPLRAATGPAQLLEFLPRLLEIVRRCAPPPLLTIGRREPPTEKSLWSFWQGERAVPAGSRFYLETLLQPWAAWLRSQSQPVRQSWEPGGRCPFCAAAPLAIAAEGEGADTRRSLICSLCGGAWPLIRTGCTCCGETSAEMLSACRTDDAGHVAAEACDVCRVYIKVIDLASDPDAVPAVDEMATMALNLWAEESGYRKREPNLLGM